MERLNVPKPKPWGETWSFNTGGSTRIVVSTVDQLIASNVYVSPEAVEGNWGKEAAEKYIQAERSRRIGSTVKSF